VVNGQKEIATPCRQYFYGLNAATGKLLWSYDPTRVKATFTSPTVMLNTGTNYHDTTNATFMTEPYSTYGGIAAGNSSTNENAPAFDGKNSVFYWTSVNGPSCTVGGLTNHTLLPPPGYNSFSRPPCSSSQLAQFKFTPAGSNFVSINASSGSLNWVDHYEPSTISNYRGGLTYTNGMVLAGPITGNLTAYNAKDGSIIWAKYMGVSLSYAPTIGSDASGNILMFLPVGGGLLWGNVPGFLAAFSFPPAVQGGTVTQTAQGSTVTQTATVTNTVVSTSTATPTTAGISATTFYEVVGVLVVVIIAVGALGLRRRGKPPA